MKLTTIRITALITISACSVFTGCASIVNGNDQVVSVETQSKNKQATGANCRLNNGKGTYYVITPGTVTVHRAYADMIIECEKASLEPGFVSVKSTTKPIAFGNIIFGGVIGAAVDVGTGAAYDYPSLISVIMGEASNAPIVAAIISANEDTAATTNTKAAVPLAKE